jgi:hypothetical protein
VQHLATTDQSVTDAAYAQWLRAVERSGSLD